MACDFNELLLNWKLNKIDIKATNNDGLTPLDILHQYCHSKMKDAKSMLEPKKPKKSSNKTLIHKVYL